MSTSQLSNAGSPQRSEPSPLVDAIAKYHSAMFCAQDCLTRCAGACSFEDLSSTNFLYADRQLMLANQYVEKARIALEIAKRELVNVPVAEPAQDAGKLFDKFEKTGPYGGDRR